MIVRRRVDISLALASGHAIQQQLHMDSAINVVKKAGQAIVATLDEVLRDIGKIHARQASHG